MVPVRQRVNRDLSPLPPPPSSRSGDTSRWEINSDHNLCQNFGIQKSRRWRPNMGRFCALCAPASCHYLSTNLGKGALCLVTHTHTYAHERIYAANGQVVLAAVEITSVNGMTWIAHAEFARVPAGDAGPAASDYSPPWIRWPTSTARNRNPHRFRSKFARNSLRIRSIIDQLIIPPTELTPFCKS